MADVSHLYFWKNGDNLLAIVIICLKNANMTRIWGLVLIGGSDPSDIGESLIYLIQYANYAFLKNC